METLTRAFAQDLVDAGGRFMTSPQMEAEAAAVGMPRGGLYFRGRVAPLGDTSPAEATRLLGIFPAWLVEATWESSAALPWRAAAGRYAAAAASWGSDHITGAAGNADLVALARRVIDAASLSDRSIAAAWRSWPWPEREGAQAAWSLMLLREIRGLRHFAALAEQGLSVDLAIVADPRGGPARLRRTAWRPDEVDQLLARAEAEPDLHSRWRAAEAATDTAYGADLIVLDRQEQERLAGLIAAAADLTA